MKTLNHLFTIFACILLLSSCCNKIVPDDIYGIWTAQEQTYPFDQYIRQNMSYVENGHLFVRIELNTSVYASKGIGYTALKQDVFLVEDGGPAHATATIDLTAKRVIVFMTNGNA